MTAAMSRSEADALLQRVANLHSREWQAVVVYLAPRSYGVEVLERATRQRTVIHAPEDFAALVSSRRKRRAS